MMLGWAWVWVTGQEESNTHTHPEVAEVSSSKALKPCKLRVSGYVRACLALCLPQKM